MRRALIVVDVQNDFLPGGALAVPQGDDVIEPIIDMIRSGRYDMVIGTADWHPADHCSFDENPLFEDGSWPAHCVAGTEGAQYPERLREWLPTVLHKGQYRDAEAYSGFANPDLLRRLRHGGIEAVDVVGLAEDYCVKATALDAQREGFATRVILGATKGVTATGETEAEGELSSAKVELVYPCVGCEAALPVRCCEFGQDTLDAAHQVQPLG